MIRRPDGDGFRLITQGDHARFSGLIAAALAANGFAPPTPHAEVIAAIAGHDAGWVIHDDAPTLNERGQPLHVFEVAVGLATRIWANSVERAKALGPYATLLVSLHQLALSESLVVNRTLSPVERFELNKFQHKQIELQGALRRALKLRTDLPLQLGLAKSGVDEAEDLLTFNFRLLTLCDRLSLQLCCGKLLFPEIEGVRPGPGLEPTTLRTAFVDDQTMSVTPWPFALSRVQAAVPYCSVGGSPIQTEEGFRMIYGAAPGAHMSFALIAG